MSPSVQYHVGDGKQETFGGDGLGWSGFWRQDCCSSLYRLYKLATLRREYLPPLLIMSDDFPGMRPLSDCVVDGDTKVSELTFPSDVIYILQPQ